MQALPTNRNKISTLIHLRHSEFLKRIIESLQLPDPNSCSKWTLCVNGRELNQECAPNTWFSDVLGTCDLAENVECKFDTCRKLPSGIGMAPSPNNCDQFFFCYNYEKVSPGTCQEGLAFDAATRRCIRRDEVTCFPGAALRPNSQRITPPIPQPPRRM